MILKNKSKLKKLANRKTDTNMLWSTIYSTTVKRVGSFAILSNLPPTEDWKQNHQLQACGEQHNVAEAPVQLQDQHTFLQVSWTKVTTEE